MKKITTPKKRSSTDLTRTPLRDNTELMDTVQWVGFSALGIFLALLLSYMLEGNYKNSLVTSIGIIPIVIALIVLRKGDLSLASTILAATIIFLITWLATQGQGINDIGVLGYPVILIVAGLILRGRVILYLTLLIIICMAWLVFGNVLGIYKIIPLTSTNSQDFFFGSIIILIAGNAVYRLVRNIYNNLQQAEMEVEIRRQTEAEREALIHQLKSKNQELDRFALRVSHDLKTPLITLAGFLGYLDQDIRQGKTERAEKDIAQINEAAKTMGQFVDELLDLSRVGRITNTPTESPFGDIVQVALKAVDGLIRAKQVEVQVDADFPRVFVDRPRMVQVLQNLITNAVKFMGKQSKPVIKIGSERIGGEIVFFVSDNGIGIAKEHHESVFELFNKLNPEIEGTGLGLGLVKKIIEAHDGRIWVESERGKGSTFKFTLKDLTKADG